MNVLRICFATVFGLFSLATYAQPGVFQPQPGDYRDGVYDKENANNRRFIPYTHLREGDVTWEKRVWRKLDMREKQNQQLYYPELYVSGRTSLMQVLLKHILTNEIIAFKNEEFIDYYELSEVRNKMVIQGDSTDVETMLPDGSSSFERKPGLKDSTWLFEKFIELDIKEDWFFDKQKSTLEVRILGLGINALKPGKEEAGPITQFWVYFPNCRKYFAQYEVYNSKNDSERRTFEDIFWKRQFSSRAYKESNVYDRDVEFYSKGIDALLESDRIKNDIFKWEHDLWHF
ncbi:MAG: gliding motility protein GldN [Bacteroidia bacterium]|nr:gliding motility protein GldN [Bacteroidia bacterium]